MSSDVRERDSFTEGPESVQSGDEPAADARSELFQFNMFRDAAFATGQAVPMTVIFDPDGTNMGPPLGPP